MYFMPELILVGSGKKRTRGRLYEVAPLQRIPDGSGRRAAREIGETDSPMDLVKSSRSPPRPLPFQSACKLCINDTMGMTPPDPRGVVGRRRRKESGGHKCAFLQGIGSDSSSLSFLPHATERAPYDSISLRATTVAVTRPLTQSQQSITRRRLAETLRCWLDMTWPVLLRHAYTRDGKEGEERERRRVGRSCCMRRKGGGVRHAEHTCSGRRSAIEY
ncbi:hypothetical protein GGR52DRAFT_18164 [Hypoxylon sp. FL1284]|nr:hypothetical protein GGR52DRAFT_18164 [Hypoxylon sp. FL1284]